MGCSHSVATNISLLKVEEGGELEDVSIDQLESAPCRSSWSFRSSSRSSWFSNGVDALAKKRKRQIAHQKPMVSPAETETVHYKENAKLHDCQDEQNEAEERIVSLEDTEKAFTVNDEENCKTEETLRLAAQYFGGPSDQVSVEGDDGWTTGTGSDSDIDADEQLRATGAAAGDKIENEKEIVTDETPRVRNSSKKTGRVASKKINSEDQVVCNGKYVDLVYHAPRNQSNNENFCKPSYCVDHKGKNTCLPVDNDIEIPVPSRRKLSAYYHGADKLRGVDSPFLVKRGVVKAVQPKGNSSNEDFAHRILSSHFIDKQASNEESAQRWLLASLTKRKKRRTRHRSCNRSNTPSALSTLSTYSFDFAGDNDSLLAMNSGCAVILPDSSSKLSKTESPLQSSDEKTQFKKEKKRLKKAAKKKAKQVEH
jgi:hypothetical protein